MSCASFSNESDTGRQTRWDISGTSENIQELCGGEYPQWQLLVTSQAYLGLSIKVVYIDRLRVGAQGINLPLSPHTFQSLLMFFPDMSNAFGL